MPTLNPLAQNQALHYLEVVADPAAGAEAILSRPPYSHVQLQHLTFRLVTDVNVASRLAWISLETAAIHIPLGSAATVHAGGLTYNYICTQNPLLNMGPPPTFWHLSLPPIRSTMPTDTYKINIDNIQVGDQISLIYGYWKVWRGLT